MKRSQDRILTTHVGSIVRPRRLQELETRRRSTAAIDEADYTAALAEATRDVVTQQLETGIDVINDGEFGKSSWSNYILERVTGFELRPDELRPLDWLGRDRQRFAEFFAAEMPRAIAGMPAEACVGPVRYRGHLDLARAIANLETATSGAGAAEVFMTAVAPASTAYNGVNEHYANERDYVFAIADALHEEYAAIHEAGFLVQIDDAVLANLYDHLIQDGAERYREWAELRIAALNRALEGIPEDRVRYHVCFGSWHVPHVADAPLEEIVELVLGVKAQAYSIEAANPRHEHEWRVWQNARLPEGKILIPGVITHHTRTVEHPRLVADRIVRFATLVGRENVIAGADCGFAQTHDIERTHASIMWAKLRALVEGAEIASRELWSRSVRAPL